MLQDSPKAACGTVENSASMRESGTILAGFAKQPLHTFTGDDGHHGKGCDRIGPPPAQQRVQE